MRQPDAPDDVVRLKAARPRARLPLEENTGSTPKTEHEDDFPSMWDGILFDLIDD